MGTLYFSGESIENVEVTSQDFYSFLSQSHQEGSSAGPPLLLKVQMAVKNQVATYFFPDEEDIRIVPNFPYRCHIVWYGFRLLLPRMHIFICGFVYFWGECWLKIKQHSINI